MIVDTSVGLIGIERLGEGEDPLPLHLHSLLTNRKAYRFVAAIGPLRGLL